MSIIDWIFVLLPLVCILGVAVYTHRYVKSVADFLSGGQCAGRYLIANAFGESASGVANTMSKFEIVLISGFTVAFWDTLSIPIKLFVAATGFVVFRYRQTRALTLAQFLEMRYSKRFRLFMGILAFVAGILNYGIFPAVSSRFFVYFMDLPHTVSVFGADVPTTTLIMASYLACVVSMLMLGGQITLMVTDCVEGLVSMLILLIVIAAIYMTMRWPQVAHVLGSRPPRNSMLNPFDAWDVADFNILYVIMSLVLTIYGTMAFQNTQGFNSAARTPHESRMANMLGNWRLNVRIILLGAIGTAAVTFLKHPSYAAAAAPALQMIHGIENPQIQKQMTITAALPYLLPVGIKGLFCSTMIMGLLAGDCSHIHSWASILVQDVILPTRERPLSTRQHLWLLRIAMLFVACFAFTFSLLFTQTHYIAIWWQITTAIFVSGAGAVIIGGLYWRKGTTGAAWASVIVGAVLALSGILINQYWAGIRAAWDPRALASGITLPQKFWLNGTQVAFWAMIAASSVYVIVSLLTSRHDFNLDRMLHRGKYALAEDIADPGEKRRSILSRIAGVDHSFTRGDRWVAISLVGWSLLIAAINLVVCAFNTSASRGWPLEWWSRYWLIFGVGVPFAIGTVTLIWFTIGGVKDLRAFFHALRTIKRDATDDGRVADQPTAPVPPAPTDLTQPTEASPIILK